MPGILNAHTLLRLASIKCNDWHNWHPARQSFHAGRFFLTAALNGLYYWPHQVRGGFINQNEIFEKSQELKGPLEKKLKPVAILVSRTF
jgi:hypothetical protein